MGKDINDLRTVEMVLKFSFELTFGLHHLGTTKFIRINYVWNETFVDFYARFDISILIFTNISMNKNVIFTDV